MTKYFAAVVFLFCLNFGQVKAQDSTLIQKDSPFLKADSVSTEFADSAKTDKKDSFFKVWSFGLTGGYAYRLPNKGTRTNDPYSRYLKKMKTGYSVGADVHRYLWPNIGLGLKYNIYKSQGTYDSKNKDDITIQFVGPSAIYRYPFKNNTTSVLAGFAMGYQSYSNKGKSAAESFKTKGNALGWGVSVGLEQKLSNHLALNITGACYLGTSYKFRKEIGGVTETIKLSREKFEDLSRAEITLGLKFF